MKFIGKTRPRMPPRPSDECTEGETSQCPTLHPVHKRNGNVACWAASLKALTHIKSATHRPQKSARIYHDPPQMARFGKIRNASTWVYGSVTNGCVYLPDARERREGARAVGYAMGAWPAMASTLGRPPLSVRTISSAEAPRYCRDVAQLPFSHSRSRLHLHLPTRQLTHPAQPPTPSLLYILFRGTSTCTSSDHLSTETWR